MSENITIIVEGVEYSVLSIVGKVKDASWNYRESKYIKLEMSAAEVAEIFKDDISWSIVERGERSAVAVDEEGNIIYDEDGNIVMETTEAYRNEYDNSEYCVLGDIVVRSDGTCTVAMGKPTDAEKMQVQLANAITEEELAAAYNEGVNSL